MKNVGSIDKIVRFIAGIIMLAAGYYFKSWWGAIGIVPIFTALMGWCPAYTLFGIKTCPVSK